MASKPRPKPRPNFIAKIMKVLDPPEVGDDKIAFKPYLSFSDLHRRTGINRKTLSRYLQGLKEYKKIIAITEYSPSMRAKHRVDRRYRTFYRVNPETYPHGKNFYRCLSWERDKGRIAKTYMTVTRGTVVIPLLTELNQRSVRP
jgi:hypothetical protein